MDNRQTLKNIFIISNKLKRLLDKKHSTSGISSGQARLLAFLYRMQDETIYQKDIEAEFQIRGGSVTGILDTLESSDLINRVASVKDRRKKTVVLTAKGLILAKKSIKTVRTLEADIANLLTKKEEEFFTNTMIKISDWTDMEELNEKTI